MGYLIQLINILANLLILLLIVNSILSYFLSPYHPVRAALERFFQPLLAPIRRIVPPLGMFDLSPLVLIILIEIVAFLLTRFLLAI
jgi:YggT family protein